MLRRRTGKRKSGIKICLPIRICYIKNRDTHTIKYYSECLSYFEISGFVKLHDCELLAWLSKFFKIYPVYNAVKSFAISIDF